VESGRRPDAVALEFARQVRERLGPRARKIILFGSRARGDARSASDCDVVVVVDRRSPDLREALLEIEVDLMDRYGSLVACLLRDEGEWAASQGLPIGLNVAREGSPSDQRSHLRQYHGAVDTTAIEARLEAFFEGDPRGAVAVYLFGSVARGEARSDSDAGHLLEFAAAIRRKL
jgi:predicted nucleotidyltransferase